MQVEEGSPAGTAPAAPPSETSEPARHRTSWIKEIVLVVVFYFGYSAVRNQFGSARIGTNGVPEQAFAHAMDVINLEQALGLFHEQTVQSWFLPYRHFIQFWNTYYGTAHFIVTIAVFLVLFVKRPDVFPLFRNVLLATTALALVGYSFFPLMPPRLLDQPCPPEAYGGACIETDERPADGFGFVDTLAEYGGPWSFDSGAMKSISNQYAAMPSMHIGWATWCVLALWPITRRRWMKALLVLYPAATLFCIVVTANHYWLDGVGGLVTLAAGFGVGWALFTWNRRRVLRSQQAEAVVPSSGAHALDTPTGI